MISVCIDMMFADYEFLKRIDEVKKCGINNVEFWKWSNKNIDEIQKSGINVSVFNLDSSNEKLSHDLSRGILNQGRAEEFLFALDESISVYKQLKASGMIVLIGEHGEYCEKNIFKCLTAAKHLLEKNNVTLLIEPLNNIDRKGYVMPYAKPVLELISKVNSPHIKMLYDIYHQNMMEDFNLDDIKNNIDCIGHFHVADCPGRHEPGTGNIDYMHILNEIKNMPYKGYVGLEYRATKPEHETFGFLHELKLL